MAGKLRMVVRFALFGVMTAILLVPRMLVMTLEPVAPRLERRLRRPIVMIWGRLFARIIGMRIRLVGTPPKPPFFLVANHVSYLDTFLLVTVTGGIFIAREDVQRWFGGGFLAKAGNTLFIDRTNVRDTHRVNELIHRELARGTGIVLYAEARTSAGRDVRPFKSGLLEPPVALGIPVHYCAIHYETLPDAPPASEVICWHTPIRFMAHVRRMLELRAFNATVSFGPEPLRGADRKELSRELHDAVLERFVPIQ